MHLALPQKTRLPKTLVVDALEREILVHQLRHGARELHLVLAVLRLERQRMNGRRRDRVAPRRLLRARTRIARETIAGLRMLQPPEGERVSLLRLALLRQRAPQQTREARDLFLAAGREQGLAVGEASAQHARQRELAAVRGVNRADYLRERRAVLANAQPFARRRDARRLVAQSLQEARDAGAAFGRTEKQRRDEAAAQLLGEIVEDLVARRLNVGDELLHQFVVVIGETLEHRIALFLLMQAFARQESR